MGSPPTVDDPSRRALERGAAVGRFLVLEEIGAGSMGIVYAAYDPHLDRKVAIKVVRPDSSRGETQRARLLLEAQAVARLSHPNVITVYEAGDRGEDIFVAMELVEGGTLSRWMRGGPRPWTETRAVFVRVGSGLAAAHAAGLVHRGFKPDNVLVGDDGRVRVTDFGLAGTAGDARADQLAFCVALNEALFGDSHEPPRGGAVPEWLRRVVLRGLRPDPDQRYPSMEALLADLGRDPGRTRRRAAVAAVALALAAAGGLATWRAQAADRVRCAGAERNLAGVWDAEVKGRAQAAFLATGAPYAAAAWSGVARTLDGYRDAWVRMHTGACEATLRGEQSARALDLRMSCLARRRGELGALTGLFATADARVVERSGSAAASLPAVEGCADVERLSEPLPLPEDAAARGQIAAARAQIAVANAYRLAGKAPLGRAVAGPALAIARATLYGPVIAEALLAMGMLHTEMGDRPAAERTLFDAVVAAASAAAFEVEADARTQLAVALDNLSRHDEALRSGELASALLTRLGGDPFRQGRLLCIEGDTLYLKGALEDARAHYQRGLETLQSMPQPKLRTLANCLKGLGMVASAGSRHEDALGYHRQALAILEKEVGPDHPAMATALTNTGMALMDQVKPQAALADLQRALAIDEKAFPGGRPSIAIELLDIAGVYSILGDDDRAAAAYRRGLGFAERFSPAHVVAAFHVGLGILHHRHGRFDEALDAFRRALALQEATQGPDHVDVGNSLLDIGVALSAKGDRVGARASLQRALAVFEKSAGAESSGAALATSELGVLSSEEGNHAEAMAYLDRAQATLEKTVGKEHRDAGMNHCRRGDALARAGKHAQAIAAYQLALGIFEKSARSTDKATALLGMGRAQLAMGAARAAVTSLEGAAGMFEAASDPRALAEARSALASARKASAGRRAAAAAR